ncbi:MAG: pantoate--beta-alanine ligase [Acidobacteria bacterium]|uniref:Pantothenate synthetase n=1 Tax=Candidatus Polarisedimenticola svalbardensis TaxID=2886004 RepID=A0A8J6Y170_9BACT|nr:pantoate--beta-alanine ligase [Candidatus Polarisedimenticola svalbardensis]
MEIIRKVHSMGEISSQILAARRTIGFVPTMGSLHDGHLALVRRMKQLSDVVVVSIFVNPAQFGPDEDYREYPRQLTRDTDLLIAEGVDYVFSPEPDEIYPEGPATYVEVEDLSTRLEGASRPGHFRGVTTVVMKLLQIVRPTLAAFGQKDAQQAVIVRRMIDNLFLGTELLILPIVRDEDDVALSSRNANLSSGERRSARAIYRGLFAARAAVEAGERDPEAVVRAAREVVEAEEVLRVDYLELVDGELLRPVPAVEGRMLLVAAVYAGSTRLLDNVEISV